MPGKDALEVLPAAAWADGVADALVTRIAAEPDLVLCLPTGNTPGPVYERLPPALIRAGTSLGRATVVLLDEYLGLPAGHPVRCDDQLRRSLLDRLAVPVGRFIAFGVDGPDPEAACLAYDAAVRDAGGIDLVVLGLGTNGHIGMNQPGTPADTATYVIDLAPSTMAAARAYGADPPPTRGVTLRLSGILAASEVWLLVSGAHKADILARTLDGPVGTDVPASLLRDHPGLRILADDTALLGRPRHSPIRQTA